MNVNMNNTDNNDYVRGYKDGKKSGATEWAVKAHDLANTMEIISKIHTSVSGAYTMKDLALKALAKYKEVRNG